MHRASTIMLHGVRHHDSRTLVAALAASQLSRPTRSFARRTGRRVVRRYSSRRIIFRLQHRKTILHTLYRHATLQYKLQRYSVLCPTCTSYNGTVLSLGCRSYSVHLSTKTVNARNQGVSHPSIQSTPLFLATCPSPAERNCPRDQHGYWSKYTSSQRHFRAFAPSRSAHTARHKAILVL